WFSYVYVHKYFNLYDSPYDAYVVFANVLNDLIETIKQKSLVAMDT
nr:alpha-amylase [Bacteroidota bacterium]